MQMLGSLLADAFEPNSDMTTPREVHRYAVVRSQELHVSIGEVGMEQAEAVCAPGLQRLANGGRRGTRTPDIMRVRHAL